MSFFLLFFCVMKAINSSSLAATTVQHSSCGREDRDPASLVHSLSRPFLLRCSGKRERKKGSVVGVVTQSRLATLFLAALTVAGPLL